MALEREYRAKRAKFRKQVNLYRRRAETILAVLEWAAPDKQRAERAESEFARLWSPRYQPERTHLSEREPGLSTKLIPASP
jgi:hypothetical protein